MSKNLSLTDFEADTLFLMVDVILRDQNCYAFGWVGEENSKNLQNIHKKLNGLLSKNYMRQVAKNSSTHPWRT